MSAPSAKHENFCRLAEKRTQAVLEAVRKLSNLASPNYDYEQPEVEQVFAAIDAAVADARDRFARRGKDKTSFSF